VRVSFLPTPFALLRGGAEFGHQIITEFQKKPQDAEHGSNVSDVDKVLSEEKGVAVRFEAQVVGVRRGWVRLL